jgi:Rod binding domain-containing protein
MTKPSSLPAVALPAAAAPAVTRAVAAAPAGTRPSPAADPAKIAKSAHDFEAMAIGQLLQPMFDTVDTAHGKFGGGPGEEAWKPLLVQEFAKQIEAHGGLGLAKPVYDAMLRMQGTNPK